MFVKSRVITALAASAAVAFVPSVALAQRPTPPSPEQRIERLERQIQQMQRQIFPKGRPADTAGFSDDPAATQSSVVSLDQRLDALERQMADLVRQSEENGNRLRTIEGGLTQMKSDQDQRITAIEQKMSTAAAVAPAQVQETAPATTPAKPKPGGKTTPPKKTAENQVPGEGGPAPVAAAALPAVDEGEDAYSQGFHLWEAGQYDQAIAQLKAFTAAFPKHRRTSYANNLIGRALLDEGKYNDAAAVLLANYRGNPNGERAADSLFYLGQAVMKLGQPGQACRAYAEFDAIYGAKARADLKKQVADAKAQAQCG